MACLSIDLDFALSIIFVYVSVKRRSYTTILLDLMMRVKNGQSTMYYGVKALEPDVNTNIPIFNTRVFFNTTTLKIITTTTIMIMMKRRNLLL